MSKKPDSFAGRLPDQNRLNQMAGDAQRRKKPLGRLFWFMFSLLFIAACVLIVMLFGGLVKSGVEALTSGGRAETVEPAAQEAAPESGGPDASVAAPLENKAEPPADKIKDAPPALTTENRFVPQTIGETDIYLDEDGVWRNLNRGGSASSGRGGSSPLGFLGPLLSGGGAGAEIENNGQAEPGRDLMSIGLGVLTGGGLDGLFSGGGEGLSPGGLPGLGDLGDLSGFGGLFEQLMGAGGGGSGFSPGLPGGDFFQDIQKNLGGGPSAAIRPQMPRFQPPPPRPAAPQNRIENFSGFERFDPQDAEKITSDWEYFQDPR